MRHILDSRFVLLLIGLVLMVLSVWTWESNEPHSQEESGEIGVRDDLANSVSIEDQLNAYFDGNEIEPYLTINNIEGDINEIDLDGNKLKWINKDREVQIKINRDLFSLKDEETLNSVWNGKTDLDYLDRWDRMKLWKNDGRDIIGIEMSKSYCSGLGCGSGYQLVYDLSTGSKSFFGTYSMERDVKLYDFDRDGILDYVAKEYIGERQPVEDGISGFSYSLHSLNNLGVFEPRFDENKAPFRIRVTTSWSENKIVNELVEENWIEQIE